MIKFQRLILMLIAGCAAATVQAEDVIQSLPGGEINWTEGVVYADGYGTASPDITLAAQRRLLSRRAAVVDAQRNLLEITKGVRLTSMTKVSDMMVANDTTATRVRGVVKGAVVVKENYQNDIYSVTMMMPVGGKLMQAVLDKDQMTADIERPSLFGIDAWDVAAAVDSLLAAVIAPVQAATNLTLQNQQEADTVRRILGWLQSSGADDVEGALRDSVNRFDQGARFSGLLVDASQVNSFEIAAVPTIRDEEGNIVYPNDSTSFGDIVEKRGVTYDLDLDDAIRNDRVATSPFVVNAVGTYKNQFSDLVISKADAQRIAESASTLDAMQRAGVLIVIGI